MTNHKDVLASADAVLKQRGEQYGPADTMFDRISIVASVILNKPISAYDVSMIMVALKLARMQEDRTYDDNYVDAINYLAFAAQFASSEESIEVAVEDDIKSKVLNIGTAKMDVKPADIKIVMESK